MTEYEVTRQTARVEGIERHLVQVPAHVQCDVCNDQYQAGEKWMNSVARARLAADLRRAGWQVDGDHERHVCPICRSKAVSVPRLGFLQRNRWWQDKRGFVYRWGHSGWCCDAGSIPGVVEDWTLHDEDELVHGPYVEVPEGTYSSYVL